MLHRFSSLVSALVLIAIVSLFGCNGSSLNNDNTIQNDGFRFGFGLVRDIGTDSIVAVANFKQDDSTITTAVISIQSKNLVYSTNKYLFAANSVDTIPAGAATIMVGWGTFADTLMETVTADLAITSLLPPIKGPADRVNIDWSGSAGAETYVVAAVKQDSAYIGLGFSQYVTSQATSVTVEDSAFTKVTLSGAEPNPGIYNVYIYSISGSPDSALTSNELPVPLPSQLTENASGPNYIAFSGVVTVSPPVTVEVVAAP